MRHYLHLLAFLLPAIGLAQQDLGTHFMRGIWQANRTNPALLPDAKVAVGLPGLYNSFYANDLTYNRIIRTRNGQTVLELDEFIDRLEDRNFLKEYLDVETLSLGLTFGSLHFNIGHTAHAIAYSDYPRELVQFFWQGNAQFVGQTVDIGLNGQVKGYHAFALGFAYQFPEGLTLGMKVKLLNGFGDTSTGKDQEELRLTTSDDVYQLTLDSDFRLNTTGDLQYNGLDDIEYRFAQGNFQVNDLFSSNFGFAFDLGARYQSERWDLAFSLIDLGRISWDRNVVNLSLQGEDTFEGLDAINDLIRDSAVNYGILDTLESIFAVDSTFEAYRTVLPAGLYLSANYRLSRIFSVGALFYSEFYRGSAFPAFIVSGQARLSKWFQGGITYGFRQRSWDNLGLNAAVSLGPVQIVASTDTFLDLVRPFDADNANFRLGLNLVFTRQEPEWTERKREQGFFGD
jgi:hypothetical protein